MVGDENQGNLSKNMRKPNSHCATNCGLQDDVFITAELLFIYPKVKTADSVLRFTPDTKTTADFWLWHV